MQNPQIFHFRETADGSPSLSFGEKGEWMHHQAGAFSETVYVYGHAIQCALEKNAQTFLIVGLGLGYIEILLAAEALRTQQTVRVQSYEAEPLLRQNFQNWLAEGCEDPHFQYAYDKVLALTCAHTDVPPRALRAYLKKQYASGNWALQGPMELSSVESQRFDAILFDAFSADSSPELWSKAFLQALLDQATAQRCLFATYASTGELKRSLLKRRFQLADRAGFGGKRECTLAVRP